MSIDFDLQCLIERAEKAEKFKCWVHDYLDAHGVPHHPPGTHGDAGCRIGDRMDWLMAKLATAEADAALARNSLDVQMRRKDWFLYYDTYCKFFMIDGHKPNILIPSDVQREFNWQDPLTAWVEGDQWYKEHVDAKA